ncbi:hypothetical protein GCM10010276_30880 [Streptomyces longisporus]|uniref:Uncharacterized protein n=1 Tax=Streptomyces longisporus TaxID=1948 RepID=A0ABN3LUG5_STRLO
MEHGTGARATGARRIRWKALKGPIARLGVHEHPMAEHDGMHRDHYERQSRAYA